MTKQPPRWKTAVIIWIGIYPTITTILYLLSPLMVSLPLPIKTLILTLVAVPTMVWVVLPFLHKIFGAWLHR